MQVPPDLQREIQTVTSTNVQALQGEEARRFVHSAMQLTERCIDHLEGEIRRLNEHRFSAPDPGALRHQHPGAGGADVARSAADQRHLALDTTHGRDGSVEPAEIEHVPVCEEGSS